MNSKIIEQSTSKTLKLLTLPFLVKFLNVMNLIFISKKRFEKVVIIGLR